jgi:hypothetical protein
MENARKFSNQNLPLLSKDKEKMGIRHGSMAK